MKLRIIAENDYIGLDTQDRFEPDDPDVIDCDYCNGIIDGEQSIHWCDCDAHYHANCLEELHPAEFYTPEESEFGGIDLKLCPMCVRPDIAHNR